jgi:hypothetical protein
MFPPQSANSQLFHGPQCEVLDGTTRLFQRRILLPVSQHMFLKGLAVNENKMKAIR